MSIDIIKTLQFLKPEIQVSIFHFDPKNAKCYKEAQWVQTSENDHWQVVYSANEDFKPTAEEILAVDQNAVKSYWDDIEAQQEKKKIENVTKQDLLDRIKALETQIAELG